MAEPLQNYKNHARRDPKFHLSLSPLLVLNVVASIVWTVRHHAQHPHLGFWVIGMSFVLLWMAMLIRIYALQNQDRIIRLEERLRLAALLPASEVGLPYKLTSRQLIALRFASDMELPTLARRCSVENLAPEQIKQNILTWRPDHERI